MGFVGCMRDLTINGNAIDIAGYARQQDTSKYFFFLLSIPFFFNLEAQYGGRKSSEKKYCQNKTNCKILNFS